MSRAMRSLRHDYVGVVSDQTPWLSDSEQRLWRRWLLLQAKLSARLNRSLQADSGLSLPDFEVLARLTDEAEHKLRIQQLAIALDWERSRLSHHVRRMQKRGLVERLECPEDNRGAYVVLTAAGLRVIEEAAPDHVRTVRRIVFDTLSAHELHLLDTINRKMLHQLDTDTEP
jgi:DNA-binding MarR family transcriptional regulator